MICLLDTAAIIHEIRLECKEIYLTSKIIEEAKTLKAKLRLDYILAKGKIYEPSKSTLKKIKEEIKELVKKDLSEADFELIASAFELKEIFGNNLIVYTDDYSIQNILSFFGINFKPVATKGIKRVIKWIGYCKNCNRYSNDYNKNCEICGGKLIKVLSKKVHI